MPRGEIAATRNSRAAETSVFPPAVMNSRADLFPGLGGFSITQPPALDTVPPVKQN